MNTVSMEESLQKENPFPQTLYDSISNKSRHALVKLVFE